jgi:hypothetical protein
MACAGQTGGQSWSAGGYSNRTTNVTESVSDFYRPWNKNTLKTQHARKKTLHKANQNTSKIA